MTIFIPLRQAPLLAVLAVLGAGGAEAKSFVATTTAATTLPTAGGTPIRVLAVTVPAGSWAVYAKASAVNFGAWDYMRCALVINTVQFDSATTMVGDSSNQPLVATIKLETVFTASASHVYELDCQHDSPQAGEYIDPQASLIVLPTSKPITQ